MRTDRAANFRLLIEYDGTEFSGWQRQAGARTVQGELERACRRLAGRRVNVTGAGRTDAGVHAAGQVASARIPWRHSIQRLPQALNALLPADVAILAARRVRRDFCARKHAVERGYRYAILNRSSRPVLLKRYALWFPHRLDLGALKRAAAQFKGRHDFSAFCTARARRRGAVRTLTKISVRARAGLITLDVAGRGFLHHMVRMMVGALLAVGSGRLRPDRLRLSLAGSLARAPQTAPARGLALVWVRYRGERRPSVHWPPGPAISRPPAS